MQSVHALRKSIRWRASFGASDTLEMWCSSFRRSSPASIRLAKRDEYVGVERGDFMCQHSRYVLSLLLCSSQAVGGIRAAERERERDAHCFNYFRRHQSRKCGRLSHEQPLWTSPSRALSPSHYKYTLPFSWFASDDLRACMCAR